MPHQARSFPAPPDADEARSLLGEIAAAPCRLAPVAADRPLALYGAGNLGRLARDFLGSVGHDLSFVVDRNAGALAQQDWPGIDLFAPAEVPDKAKRETRLAVAVVTAPYVPIERSLLAAGFGDVVPFYDVSESFRDRHPLSNGWFAPPLSRQDRDCTSRVLALWHDDISRAQHLQFLAWRRLRAEWSFAEAPPPGQRFFIPEVLRVLRGDEIFVDAGAYDGVVTQGFLQATRGACRHIFAIEPDPDNRARLLHAVNGDTRISIDDFALAETEGEATFHAGLGYASQLAETGRMRVATRPLDALGLSPSFIKLHLEGGELAALKGARQTLLAHRPIVAATVYHNADGIWRTPLWLMETLPDYRFLFRAHSWCGTGAVVYAIPNERAA
ncbi:MAG TPA: FkbM family methyltransferase [Pseudolabrys sp.]|nr:FkbM family methyltransferase [Pseudolabrys sp.]